MLLLLSLSQDLVAQNDPLQQVVDISRRKYSIQELLDEVIPSYGFTVSYHDNIVPLKKKVIFYPYRIYTVSGTLEKICRNENLEYEVVGKQVLIKFYNRPEKEYEYTIGGKVKDADSGDVLIGATVFVRNIKSGIATNAYGFYSLSLSTGNYEITCSYVGYRTISTVLDLNKNIGLNFEMFQKDAELDEVTVEEYNPFDLKAHNILLSSNRIDMDMVENIPYLGEVDVFQSSLLLPGISNIGEGASGINVRSGSPDRNLIMLDEATLYNSNHFFGLISVFNPDATSDVEILKGDFPAKYGGRASSVMHIRQKEGDENDFHISGGIGLLTSRLMVEGPAFNDNASYLVSGRATFWDMILRNSNNPSLNDLRANFQDFNGKMKFNVNSNNKIYFSSYFGADATKIGTNDLQRWGNLVSSLRWNRIIKNRHFMNLTSYYSRYEYRVVDEQDFSDFVGKSSISDYSIKVDFTSYINPFNLLEYGASSIVHYMQPGRLEPGTSSNFVPIALNKELGIESAVYLSSENRILPKLTTSLGLRVTNFINTGRDDVYLYEDGVSKSVSSIMDTVSGNTADAKIEYWNVLPRVSLKFEISSNTSAKLGYSRSAQYIHQLSNTVAPSSSDTWRISNQYIKPIVMDQVTLGLYHYFPAWDLHLTSEMFYRYLDNVIDYKNGADLVFNPAIEHELLFGEEQVYGIEFLAKKSFGKFSGWIGYTLSKAERKIDSNISEDRLNDGEYFPSDFDRTHDFAFTTVFEPNKRWVFSGNFVFYTGRPYSFPDSKYEFDGILVPHYPNRNLDRLSNYHRLDLSVKLKLGSKRKKEWAKSFNSSWVFSLYNVYGRRNAQAYFFTNTEGDVNNSEIQRLSILAFPIPSITYNFTF
ncbi:MAG: TonB-dependent receptor [Reichenbachiella sp.]